MGPARKKQTKKETKQTKKKTGNKPKVVHLSTSRFIKCSFLFIIGFSIIKVISCHVSGGHIMITNTAVPTCM